MSDADVCEELCDIECGLNEWETSFVESVTKQVLDDGRPLTDKQRNVALRIMEENESD